MAVLFDLADKHVHSVLDLAKAHGKISLADLESIVESGIEAHEGDIPMEDIEETIWALADLGIEIDDGLTEEQRDDENVESMYRWDEALATANGVDFMSPNLASEGMISLMRIHAREEAASNNPDPQAPSAAEKAAARREILSKRTWIQELFASLGPQIRNLHRMAEEGGEEEAG